MRKYGRSVKAAECLRGKSIVAHWFLYLSFIYFILDPHSNGETVPANNCKSQKSIKHKWTRYKKKRITNMNAVKKSTRQSMLRLKLHYKTSS